MGGLSAILVALIALAIAIGVITVTAFVMRIILIIKYYKLNKKNLESGIPASQVVRQVLDANGLQDVEVKKAGFFRWLFFGNHYSVMKKTIFLRGNIIDKSTTTAIGVGLSKVGLAMQHKNKEKGFKTRYVFQILSMFSPLIFYATVIVGLVIDFITGFKGLPSFIGVAIGLVFYIVVFFCLLFTIKVEKKANAQAIYMIEKSGLLSPNDLQDLQKLFSSYIITYILEYILSILEIIYYILKFIFKIFVRKSSK